MALYFLSLLRGKLHCVLGSNFAQLRSIFAENDKNVVEIFFFTSKLSKRKLDGILPCCGPEMIFPDPDPTYQVIPDQDLPEYSELGSGSDLKAL
jgi:hypothetical protein